MLCVAACQPVSPEGQTIQRSGSITVGLPEIGTLDPARASSSSALALLRTACDGLVGLDHITGEPKPALASLWELSDGGRRLTVTLRPGIQFQDKTPVTPEAVREALSRPARPATSSPWTSLVAPIEGFHEVRSGAATHLSGVRVNQERGLIEIILREPFSGFGNVLAHPALIPVSLESLDAAPGGPDLPVCSGPYRIEQGEQDKDLRLGRVPGFEGRNDAFLEQGEGRADLIIIRSFDSGEDAYAAFGADQVDVAPVPSSRVGEARATEGFRSEAIPEIVFLAFDGTDPATRDPQFKYALSLAIDRLAIIDAAFGDERRPATGWLPEANGSTGDQTCGTYIRRIADPQQAQEIFAALGPEAAGLKLALYYDPRTTGRLAAEALELQIESVLGVQIEATPLEGQDVISHFLSRPAGPDAWIMPARINIGLPDEFLGSQPGGDPASNPLAVDDLRFKQAIEAARSATSHKESAGRYSQAEAELCKAMPGVPLWTSVGRWMFNPERVRVASTDYLDSMGYPLLRHSFDPQG